MKKISKDEKVLYGTMTGIGTITGITAWLFSWPWWAIGLSAILPPFILLYILLAVMATLMRDI